MRVLGLYVCVCVCVTSLPLRITTLCSLLSNTYTQVDELSSVVDQTAAALTRHRPMQRMGRLYSQGVARCLHLQGVYHCDTHLLSISAIHNWCLSRFLVPLPLSAPASASIRLPLSSAAPAPAPLCVCVCVCVCRCVCVCVCVCVSECECVSSMSARLMSVRVIDAQPKLRGRASGVAGEATCCCQC